MYLKAYINGDEYGIWQCYGQDEPAGYTKDDHELRRLAWQAYVVECKLAYGDAFASHPGMELFIHVKARVQPKDLSEESMLHFNHQVDLKKALHESGLL